MLTINTPLSLWIQLMSLCFFSSGWFTDLMMVRTCLTMAYIFLMLNSWLGSPLWPELINPGRISIDSAIWAFLNLWVHFSSLTRLWLDEGRVAALSEHHESLWRLFYRTGGLSRKVFYHTVAKHVTLVEYTQGQTVPFQDHFYIVYQGTIQLTAVAKSTTKSLRRQPKIKTSTDTVASGQMFDYRLLGLLHEEDRLQHGSLKDAVVTSRSATLFCFPRSAAANVARAHKTVWLQLLTQDFSRNHTQSFVKSFFYKPGASTSDFESSFRGEFLADYLHPKFAPLREWEMPDKTAPGSGEAARSPLRHVLRTMKASFNPPWPIGGHLVGLRHRLPAPTKDVEDVPDLIDPGNEQSRVEKSMRQSLLMHSVEFDIVEEDDEEEEEEEVSETGRMSYSEEIVFMKKDDDDDDDEEEVSEIGRSGSEEVV